MKQHNTSRPATEQERALVIELLQREFFKAGHGYEVDETQAIENGIDDDREVEADFTYIANIIDESDVHTYPNFFPDADMIELRVWPVDFLNTFQQFKQFPDGKLVRHKPLSYGNEKEIQELEPMVKPEIAST